MSNYNLLDGINYTRAAAQQTILGTTTGIARHHHRQDRDKAQNYYYIGTHHSLAVSGPPREMCHHYRS